MCKEHGSEFVAICAAGMENLIRGEIVSFGGRNIVTSTGIVSWQGPLATAYRACLWSRFASRILLKIKSFTVVDTDSIYDTCRAVAWSEHLNSGYTFAVSCNIGDESMIHHSHFAALRVKDAVVDQFRENSEERPQVKKEMPDVRLNLHIDGKNAALYIDLSGESLHRRGYRDGSGLAPLKETLGAAIVALAGWNASPAPHNFFLDPMCGSGTLLIEAALLFGDSAPGLFRKHFGFTKWLGHDPQLWEDLVNEAVERETLANEKEWPLFLGYDADPVMVAIARRNIENAGLEERIQVKRLDICHLKRPGNLGYVVSNLPYGERLSEKEEVKYLYRGVGRILMEEFDGCRAGVFISQPDLTDSFSIAWQDSYKLYNGSLPCRLLAGAVEKKEKNRFIWQISVADQENEGVDFVNRLRKNMKKFQSWSHQNKINCYRIYDRDLPEYNLAIDIYEKWMLVQEFMPPQAIDGEVAKKRFSLVLQLLRKTFNISRERLFIRQRKRQKGKEQYEKKEETTRYHEVQEGDCFFLVNFRNYLDTGIFLDHRPLRLKIRQLAAGKRFLNLFGYTGTATVHAVKGGAVLTTTVDLSLNYLNWTRMNLALNGMSLQTNEIVNDDCLTWLKGADQKYDLIFIDPPTFSNTKKKDLVFDIQRDHPLLISQAMNLLTTDGLLLFSTNFRKFRLDPFLAEKYLVSDISRETIPYDFQRNSSIHKCWEMRKK